MWNSCSDDTRERALRYADREKLTYISRLGYGVHGIVLLAERQGRSGRSAVKAHDRSFSYERERDAYLRLLQHDVTQVRGHHVPQLLNHDDALLVIEISVVTRPFVLDFGGAYLDEFPDYPEEVLTEWRTEKAEQFDSRWPEVQAILREFARIGIHIADVNPGNVAFHDDEFT